MKICVVLQIKKDAPNYHYKIFEPYNTIKKIYGKVDINDYEVVWVGLVENDCGFEKVYEMYNRNYPEGYYGHSMSVSDIVIMDDKIMYCDDIGFKELKL